MIRTGSQRWLLQGECHTRTMEQEDALQLLGIPGKVLNPWGKCFQGGCGVPVWLLIPSQGLGGRLRVAVLTSEEEAILLSRACTFKKAARMPQGDGGCICLLQGLLWSRGCPWVK